MDKLTINDVCDLLASSNEFDAVDYRIEECATKDCVAIVYFYENKLSKEEQKTVL